MGRETLRVAVLQDTAHPGLGGHGTHLAFRGLPGIEMVALADSGADGTDADRLAETGAARLYRDWREMLERERPDIAVLCSRLPGDHLEPIRMAARLGIHIFCEKPLTSDLRTADEIVALSERYRIRIAVAHLARYSLAFRTMKRMIERGEIGRVLTFYGRGKEDQRGGGEREGRRKRQEAPQAPVYAAGKEEYGGKGDERILRSEISGSGWLYREKDYRRGDERLIKPGLPLKQDPEDKGTQERWPPTGEEREEDEEERYDDASRSFSQEPQRNGKDGSYYRQVHT